MKRKRTALAIMSLALPFAATFTANSVVAQNYPDKPIRFVIPFPAGGFRHHGPHPGAKTLGQPGPARGIRQPPRSGRQHRRRHRGQSHAQWLRAAHQQQQLCHQSGGDQAPFRSGQGFCGRQPDRKRPVVMVVNSKSPWKSVQDVITAAKATPGKLNFATSRSRQFAPPDYRATPGP